MGDVTANAPTEANALPKVPTYVYRPKASGFGYESTALRAAHAESVSLVDIEQCLGVEAFKGCERTDVGAVAVHRVD